MVIGVIEKVIVDCLLEMGDDELRKDVFFAAGIPNDRVYRLDKHYPDAETARLIDAVLSVSGLGIAGLSQLFARVFFDMIDDVFPEFIRMADSSEDLVRKQAKIHALMAAGSRAPGESEQSIDKFHLQDHGPHHLTVRYKSELQLCSLYEALVRECAKRFGDEVIFSEHICAHHGADACLMTVKWTAIDGQPTLFAQHTEAQMQSIANG